MVPITGWGIGPTLRFWVWCSGVIPISGFGLLRCRVLTLVLGVCSNVEPQALNHTMGGICFTRAWWGLGSRRVVISGRQYQALNSLAD